jgi:Protein of unknown function (DUF3037)
MTGSAAAPGASAAGASAAASAVGAPAAGASAAGSARQAEQQVFEYAVLRVIPRVDRGERFNAGILLYCRPLRYLGARVALDTGLLLAMDPAADVPGVQRTLDAIAGLCTGTDPGSADQPEPGAGPAGQQDIGRRFRWLTAPRSTVVQAGPVHTGLTREPDAEIDRLLRALVVRPR